MSPRAEAAKRIAQYIRDNGLDNPFGGDVTKQGRYYSVLLSVPRYLDGAVRVYSENWILVQLQGPLVGGIVQEKCKSVDDALATLRLHCEPST